MHRIEKWRSGEPQRLVGDNIRAHQNYGQKNQVDDADDRPGDGIILEQKMRGQPAEHRQTERYNKGVVLGLFHQNRKIEHPGSSPPTVSGTALRQTYSSSRSSQGNAEERVAANRIAASGTRCAAYRGNQQARNSASFMPKICRGRRNRNSRRARPPPTSQGVLGSGVDGTLVGSKSNR